MSSYFKSQYQIEGNQEPHASTQPQIIDNLTMLLPGVHKVRSILRSRLGDDSTVASDVHQTYDDLSSVNTDMEIDENLLDDMELDLLDPEAAPADTNGQSPQSAIPIDQGPVNPKSPPRSPGSSSPMTTPSPLTHKSSSLLLLLPLTYGISLFTAH